MSKTIKRQPKWISEDDRWKKKGGPHLPKSRKVSKQQFERELEEALSNGY